MRYEEVTGNVLDSFHPGTFLVHSCNCYGNWGMGIAYALLCRYPRPYEEHKKYCKEREPSKLIGTSQVILPERIICLFTSIGHGRNKGTPAEILRDTRLALTHLFSGSFSEPIVRIVSPRINAGLFCVPWPATRDVILDVGNQQGREIEWTTVCL